MKPFRWSPIIVASGICLICVILLGNDFPQFITDSAWYLKMASGQGAEVPNPFATRVFHPAVAGAVARLLGTTTENGFRVIAICALFLFSGAVTRRLQIEGISWKIAVPILLTPFPLEMLRQGYLPDLYHAALLALFLLIVDRQFSLSMIVLIFLFLCRETTILVAIVIIYYLIARRKYIPTLGTILVSLACLTLTWVVIASYRSNTHEISGLLYLVFKFPFNLSRNLFGVELWVNTITYCTPTQIWELPNWLARGSVSAVGVCGFNFMRPLYLITYLLTTFGIFPSLGLYWWRRNGWSELAKLPLSLFVAVIYGSATLLLTPVMGAATDRLIGYAWPLFFFGVPILVSRTFPIKKNQLIILALSHLLISWLPLICASMLSNPLLANLIVVLIAGCGQVLIFRFLSNRQPKILQQPAS